MRQPYPFGLCLGILLLLTACNGAAPSAAPPALRRSAGR